MCKFTLGISSWRSSIVTKKIVFLFSLEIRVLCSFFVYFGDIPLTDDTSVINGTVVTIFVPSQFLPILQTLEQALDHILHTLDKVIYLTFV